MYYDPTAGTCIIEPFNSSEETRGKNYSKERNNMKDLKEIVKPFYTKCLTVNADANLAEIMGGLLADNFQSISSDDVKSKAQLTGQLQYFWKLIPDLKWEIQEMFQDGNTVIVRSMASGSPNGDFFGLPLTGKKSFKIMTIDFHTVENEKVVKVYHIEDWATALKQLKG
jgi:steroid delta-isomerase-like uncharacterized protein